MDLSPRLYHWIVRPKFFFNKYIGSIINSNFDFSNKMVLDFGCGVGSSCFMFDTSYYRGIDCDSKRIEYARRLHSGYKFDVFQGNQLPVECKSIDFILIISVLHHIPTDSLKNYVKEFKRVLKENGRIIIVEPCFFESSYINNRFMSFIDKGKYIKNEGEYLDIFSNYYRTDTLKKYKQLFLYNKIFFTATPK